MDKIKQSFTTIKNYIKFIYLLHKGNMIGGNSPELVLRVAQSFLTLESPRYPNTYYMGRSIIKSSELFQSLIESYFKTKSEVTLDQLLEVLKEEFIKREENSGRKQLSSR